MLCFGNAVAVFVYDFNLNITQVAVICGERLFLGRQAQSSRLADGMERGAPTFFAVFIRHSRYLTLFIWHLDRGNRLFGHGEADALAEAKNGDIPRKRGRLQEQVVALTAENKNLTKRLDRSMGETLEYAKKAETLQREKDNDSHYARVGKTLARTNPTEYKRISQGKPKNIGSFFDSVLSMFTPDVTMRIPRLQQIEREIEEERREYEKHNKNNNYK